MFFFLERYRSDSGGRYERVAEYRTCPKGYEVSNNQTTAQEKNWTFVIVGDTKTPHASYEQLVKTYAPNIKYLNPQEQESLYPELSEIIGWKNIQRRNIGFVYAYHQGSDVIVTVDDDNIPYDCWGKDLLLGKEIEVDLYEPESEYFISYISFSPSKKSQFLKIKYQN